MRIVVKIDADHVVAIVAFILTFENRDFMHDVRQLFGNGDVYGFANVGLTVLHVCWFCWFRWFHAVGIAVFQRDGVMFGVDGDGNAQLHAINDGSQSGSPIPPMVDEAYADVCSSATE